jgi:2-keto-4-pentenoate hydratase/2-oxohepta-3-ene-1,7-dioic acid hydratase in catechol pathway
MAAIGRFQKGDDIFYAKVVDGELFTMHGDLFGTPTFDKVPLQSKGVRTLPPVVPGKIIAVGLNYADHVRAIGQTIPQQPLFWFKAPSALLPDGGKIEMPYAHHRVDYEAELAIVIGREMGELVTLVDMDHYIEGNFEPGADWVVERAYEMHDHIIETFHEHVVTKDAIEVWK